MIYNECFVIFEATTPSQLNGTPPTETKQQKTRKRTADSNAHFKEEPAKRQRTVVEKEPPKERKLLVKHDPTKTVFVSNLAPFVTEEILSKTFPTALQVDLVTDRKGVSRCYAYVQFPDEKGVAPALERDRELLKGRPMFVSKCKGENKEENQSFKYSTDVEKNKLFVRGLPLNYTKKQVCVFLFLEP